MLTIASAGYYRAAAADEHQCRRDTCERDHRLPGLDVDVSLDFAGSFPGAMYWAAGIALFKPA